MKHFTKHSGKSFLAGAAVAGLIFGSASAYLAAKTAKKRMTMGEMMRCKAKEAFKSVGDRFSV